MRVLFSHSYFLHFDPKQWEQMQPYAPLGTIYAAALLRDHGYDVSLHDVMFASGPESVAIALETFRPDVFVLYDDGFNYLTKMCLTNMREAAWTMAKMAKAKGCMTIVSSSDATDRYTDYIQNGLDYVLLGEAEYTLLELLDTVGSGKQAAEVKGMVYAANEGLHNTGKRPVITDLDALPFPAWDLVDVEQYRKAWKDKNGYFSINFAT
ncbi:MAG TPA: cobalamin-dependent protein, partial [Chitinophagaceae bacterium]|nr:cobalamin-dependent protein [Chitinophagaceae bacterium]